MINDQFTPTKIALNFWRRQQTVMRSNKRRWNQNKDQEKIEKFYRFVLRISSMLKNAHFSESSFSVGHVVKETRNGKWNEWPWAKEWQEMRSGGGRFLFFTSQTISK